MKTPIETATELIQKANNIIVLTGAGISTESGLSDFRSKSGLYQHTPSEILSRDFFQKQPEVFYEFIQTYLRIQDVEPNKGHHLIARWEQNGKVSEVITQNIDGLHQAAGTKQIIEFHGTLKTATCMNPSCRQAYQLEQVFERKEERPYFWLCDCGELIKPDVVLFGDVGSHMNHQDIFDIRTRIWDCDLLLVLGTSLEVYPFSDFVRYRNKDVPTIIVNKGRTSFDYERNVLVIRQSIGDVLEQIDQNLQES